MALFSHQDDHVVPFSLGYKLYLSAKETRPSHSKPVMFAAFSSERSYAHIFIHKAPELPDIVGRFLNKTIQGVWDREDYSMEVEFG